MGAGPHFRSLELDHGGAPGVYAQWGYYVASGQHAPVMRIMQALKWSKGAQEKGFFGKLTSGWGADANNVDKVTTGGTAKWTLASYAERDRELIGLYRAEVPNQPEEIAKPLNDVIEAAELFEAENIRKEQYGAIEDAQRQQLTADAGHVERLDRRLDRYRDRLYGCDRAGPGADCGAMRHRRGALFRCGQARALTRRIEVVAPDIACFDRNGCV